MQSSDDGSPRLSEQCANTPGPGVVLRRVFCGGWLIYIAISKTGNERRNEIKKQSPGSFFPSSTLRDYGRTHAPPLQFTYSIYICIIPLTLSRSLTLSLSLSLSLYFCIVCGGESWPAEGWYIERETVSHRRRRWRRWRRQRQRGLAFVCIYIYIYGSNGASDGIVYIIMERVAAAESDS